MTGPGPMTGPFELDGPRRGAAAGQADSLIVLLHGLGADGNDLIGLTPHLARQHSVPERGNLGAVLVRRETPPE